MTKMTLMILAFVFASIPFASAQSVPSPPEDNLGEKTAEEKKSDEDGGIVLPNSDRLRIQVRFMAGYGFDASTASLGFEQQGRVGYAIVNLRGKLNERFGYVLEINPINEAQPLAACGETNYFFPNAPLGTTGPNVACDPDGRLRVDDYRSIALDPLVQQGAIRQAYLQFQSGAFDGRFGRFILPIGFGWEEVGSFTAKDATHIQRINAEANFGVGFGWTSRLAGVEAAAFLGDGNRYRDYDSFYSQDGTLDSNSALTALISGTVTPLPGMEVRIARKQGYTGSKVERVPNYWASKRNDMSTVLSARYQVGHFGSIFGEYADYTWGPTATSAQLVGADPAPISKFGYYVGGDAHYSVTHKITVGATITREELSRDDSLVKYFAAQNLFQAAMGKKERSTALRFYADIQGLVRVGVYHNDLSNPFPWLSGIEPVAGERAFQGRGSNKWGVVIRFILQ